MNLALFLLQVNSKSQIPGNQDARQETVFEILGFWALGLGL